MFDKRMDAKNPNKSGLPISVIVKPLREVTSASDAMLMNDTLIALRDCLRMARRPSMRTESPFSSHPA
jgi:hypothetical protein